MKSLIAAMLLLTACVSVQAPPPQTAADAFLTALGSGDKDIANLFTEDATVFFPMNGAPLRANGRGEIAAVFATMFGPDYKPWTPKPEDVRVQEFGEAAIVTFQMVNPNSTSRRTLVLRREAGRWRIAHLHGSNIRKETN